MADTTMADSKAVTMVDSSVSRAYRQKLLDFVASHDKSHPPSGRKKSQTRKSRLKSTSVDKSNSNPPNGTASGKSKFVELPDELLELIFNDLDVGDLASMRLMCRRFAGLGAAGLFKEGFSIRPQREDMLRLARVCLIPEIAQGIKGIEIFMGDMSPHQFMCAVEDDQLDQSLMPPEVMSGLRRLLDTSTNHLDKELLSACFSQLPNVRLISTESLGPPFSQDGDNEDRESLSKIEGAWYDLNNAWENMSESTDNFSKTHYLSTRINAKRVENLLLAIEHLPVPLENLILDAITIDMFAKGFWHLKQDINIDVPPPITVDEERLQGLKSAVAKLEGIDVGILGCGIENMYYTGAPLARAVSGFYGAMQNLRSLTFDWTIEEDFDVDFATAFDQSFWSVRFPHLENLRLANLMSGRGLITSFILGHSATLRRLNWQPTYSEGQDDGMDDLWATEVSMQNTDDRSWRDIFTEFRETLVNLVAVDIQDAGADPEPLYDGYWQRVEPGPRSKVTNPHLLQLYILGEMPWPMKKDNPSSQMRGWRPKHTTIYEEFKGYSPQVLAEIYSEDWETDNEDGDEMDEDTSDFDDDDEDDDDDDDEMGYDFDDEYHAGGEWGYSPDDMAADADDFDILHMQHAMQAMLPGVFGGPPFAPEDGNEWEDESGDSDGAHDLDDDDDVDMDDSDVSIPNLVPMDSMGGEAQPGGTHTNGPRLTGGAGPVGTGQLKTRKQEFDEFKAALGYESDFDEKYN